MDFGLENLSDVVILQDWSKSGFHTNVLLRSGEICLMCNSISTWTVTETSTEPLKSGSI